MILTNVLCFVSIYKMMCKDLKYHFRLTSDLSFKANKKFELEFVEFPGLRYSSLFLLKVSESRRNVE